MPPVTRHRGVAAGAAGLLAAIVGLAAYQAHLLAGQKNDKDRPRFTLRAQPSVGVAPVRVVLTGELVGGADDFEEYYCPTLEWRWGDDTTSESSLDCDPYEAGKSQIRRRFTVEHQFRREGAFRVYLHLKRRDRIVASASVTVQVRPGAQDLSR